MELGEKLRHARLEAGLSQRQLCGDEITRNMLSQIEHGTAQPSMKTLQYLAARLGKSVSYFLEETAVLSPNQQVMEDARRYFDSGAFSDAALTLQDYQAPDAVYDREEQLLHTLTQLALAEQAIQEHRYIYAQELLHRLTIPEGYCRQELQRKWLLLLGRLPGHAVAPSLPSLDGELFLRAEEALEAGNLPRAAALLDASEAQTAPEWNLLRGSVFLAQTQYRQAAQCFHQAETAYPRETAPKLEHCYRELEDYKRAYEYACKQK